MNETTNRATNSSDRKVTGCLVLALLTFFAFRHGFDPASITALIPSRETIINILWGIVVIPVALDVFLLVLLG